MKSRLLYKTLLLSLFFLASTFCSYANGSAGETPQDCQKLIEQAGKAMVANNYSKAITLLSEAEVMATKNQWRDKLFVINGNLGGVYIEFSNFGEAIGYYLKALDFAKGIPKLAIPTLTIYNNIGVIYAREKDYQTSLTYHKKSLLLAKEKKSDYHIILASQNISDIYNKLGDFMQARTFLLAVKEIKAEHELKQMWDVNYAESFFVEGNLRMAQNVIEKLINELDSYNAKHPDQGGKGGLSAQNYVAVMAMASKIYFAQGKIDLAISYSKRGLHNAIEMGGKVDLYDLLAKSYFKKEDYDTAFKYKDSVVGAKDSMTVVIDRGLFESNKVKLQVQDYQTQLDASNQKQEMQRNLLLVAIIMGLIISIVIYIGLKSRISRQNKEKLIASLELEKNHREHLIIEKELETINSVALFKQEQLKNKISEKNRELSAKALYLSIRNELIEEAINSLSAIPEVSKNPAVSDHIKTLNNHLKNDAGWEDFIGHFEKTNPVFLKALHEKHPGLSAKDIRFICCLFMNLDVKEIGNIFNITYDAANKRKQRIKEKMGVENRFSLYEYLLQLDINLPKAIPQTGVLYSTEND